MKDYTQEISEAAEYVRQQLNLGEKSVDIGIVLGSALGGFTEVMSDKEVIPYHNIPHMPQTSVAGHSGNLVSGQVGGKRVICFSGRVHSYEGIPLHKVCFQVRLMAALNCKLYILTNASGGAGEGMVPGSLVALRDHINFARIDPMNEFYDEFIKNRFVSSESIWSQRCCDIAQQVASDMGIKLFDGVYCWTPGPSFETPLEVSTGVKSGGVCFGMSTVPEALTAAACGMEVFGLSLATNLAAGTSEKELSHDDVKETAAQHGVGFQKLLENVVEKLDVVDPQFQYNADSPLLTKSETSWTCDTVQQSAKTIGEKLGSSSFQKAAIVSYGVRYIIDQLIDETQTIPLSDINGFPVLSKAGRDGKIIAGHLRNGSEKTSEPTLVIASGHAEGFHRSESAFLVELLYFLNVAHTTLVLSSAAADPSPSNGIQTLFIDGVVDMSRGAHIDILQQHFEPIQEHPELVSPRLKQVAEKHGIKTSKHAVFTGPCFPSTAELDVAKVHGASSVNTNDAVAFIYGLRYMGMDTAVLSATVTIEDHQTMNVLRVASVLDSAADESVTRAAMAMLAEPANNEQEHAPLTDTKDILPPPLSNSVSYEQIETAAANIKQSIDVDIPSIGIIDFNSNVGIDVNSTSDDLEIKKLGSSIALKDIPFSSHRARATPSMNVVEISGVKALFISSCGAHHETSNLIDLTSIIRMLYHLGVKHLLFLSSMKHLDATSKSIDTGLVIDHANFTGINPLFGPNDQRWGTRFPAMDHAYDAVRSRAIQDALPKIASVKAFYDISTGPILDPVMLRAAAVYGADAWAQVTVPECVVARHMSMTVTSMAVRRGYRFGGDQDPSLAEVKGQVMQSIVAWTQIPPDQE